MDKEAMPKIYLAHWDGSKKEICLQTYDEIRYKLASVDKFMRHCSYFNILIDNFGELVDALESFDVSYNSSKTIQPILDYFPLVNRLFVNALGSFHIYAERHDQYQIKSGEVKELKVNGKKKYEPQKRTSKYFDNHFIYRFFYQLRNFAVHYDIPVNTMAISIEDYKNQFYIKRAFLLSGDFKWNSIVKSDIENNSEDYKLEKCIIDFLSVIIQFHIEITETTIDNARSVLRYFTNLCKISNGKYDSPYIEIEENNGVFKLDTSINPTVMKLDEYINCIDSLVKIHK